MANSVQFEHTQRYIQEVMTHQLQQAGFVSRKGEGINWYRIVNEEVIQTVCFRTSKKYVPVWLEIGYQLTQSMNVGTQHILAKLVCLHISPLLQFLRLSVRACHIYVHILIATIPACHGRISQSS